MKLEKSLKFTLYIITISIFVLFALAVTLPWIVTWLVEVKQKDPKLPSVAMITCYPCLPFATIALFSLRKFLKNCLNGLIFGDKNIVALRKVSFCCLCGAVITLIAGWFYPPFWVLSVASAGCALIVKCIKEIFVSELDAKREELLEDMGEKL